MPPPLKPVPSLVDLSINTVVKSLAFIQRKDIEIFRQAALSILPGSIRQVILDRATNQVLLDKPLVINALKMIGDSALKCACFDLTQDKPRYSLISWCTCVEFFEVLDSYNIIGLRELHVTVHEAHEMFKIFMCDPKDMTITKKLCPQSLTQGLQRALEKGLACNMTSLSLEHVADNGTLAVLGKYAQRLKYLNIANSWMVDDAGVTQLLFKDSKKLMQMPWEDYLFIAKLDTLFSLITPDECNNVCHTLTEIRLQDTNTSINIVILLLIFVKNLKSFGGFLYGRNIGDVICILMDHNIEPLELAELQDMELHFEKLLHITKLLPKLQHLYTRAEFLPGIPDVLPTSLSKISLDFNMSPGHDAAFFTFLSNYGQSIRSIILIDQRSHFDMRVIAKFCPLLEELEAKLSANGEKEDRSIFPNLVRASVLVANAEAFLWFVGQTDRIKELKVAAYTGLGNRTIDRWIETSPKSLHSISLLRIIGSSWVFPDQTGRPDDQLTERSAYALINACSSLRTLGDTITWHMVNREQIETNIKTCNWNIELVKSAAPIFKMRHTF